MAKKNKSAPKSANVAHASARKVAKKKSEGKPDSVPGATLPVRRYQAAGGVVIHDGRMLLLERPARQEVRLPKGHIETGETATQTALRETAEEAGYGDLALLADLGSRTVEFDYNGYHYVRDEIYFLMALGSTDQAERGKHDADQFNPVWVDLAHAADRLTFPAEQEAARQAIARHAAL